MSGQRKGGIQSTLDYTLMSAAFKVRDFIRPRDLLLQEAGITEGDTVLDFGCGPGCYILPLVKLVGDSGKVYALDINTMAIRSVQKKVDKYSLRNVSTIASGCETGLPVSCVDVVLLYDILHELENPEQVLAELHRVMKPDGTLSVADHHLGQIELISRVTRGKLFKLAGTGSRTTGFSRC